ncbi:selenocysteine-specific elongation factor, putative [Phytophthora infestans T30-4]|uniref:Elongation factor Tu, chloroplastic n=1 Tax=Phytophthora infestans (strain T30-4) TaxID=403677 RepID=D0NUK8_PHYIT|nr:selenocysteine-specific elongation factor, putative [Phytophthora infestans T30-4]EEY65354.1 selenocysteine-specific elongation factor, putative [Phytophthora infestans T30-4]|eukprot:XP_002897217.1 selenocysteine-specific elongation factor, putative [Phytophthora infestans T30-4]
MSVVNVNVGVLGHVDSGKTSLVRALSTQLSTAALDKHPQSQQRGITLDLGFSSFRLQPLDQVKPSLQVTLVDCPGHASLFRTILGGVAIIDTVLLVVDCRKGLQAQTIESLLLASLIAERRVIVALTKTDLLPSVASERTKVIDAVTHEIRTFLATHFNFQNKAPIPVVPVAVGSGQEPQGIQQLLEVLSANLQVPERDTSGAFRLAVDHCFAVPGNGTVLTGTVLAGTLQKGDEIELLPIGVKTKVKTLQVFKHDVDRCTQGDRVGVRVNGLDPALVERAMAVSPPGSLTPVTQVIIPVTPVPFFRGAVCKSGAKCHVTVGHTTVMATFTFFSRLGRNKKSNVEFDPSALYEYVSDLDFGEKRPEKAGNESTKGDSTIFALLQLEHAVYCPPKALVVCSRLDLDAKRFSCRLAFYGSVEFGRVKSRDGLVDKVAEGAGEVIGRDLFSKDVKWSVYQNSEVLFEQAQVLGTILGPFGKAGKFRIALEKIVFRFLKLMALKPPNFAKRRGQIERLKGETTADGRNPFAIVSGLFDTEQEAKDAVGSRIRCSKTDGDEADEGAIEKPFGKAGKVRVDFQGCEGTKGQVGDIVELY